MAPTDSEASEEGGGVVGHVLNEVDGRGRVAGQERAEVGQTFELGRESAVTVVETDDEEAAVAQPVDELLRPGDQLRPQPHDQEDGRVGWIPLREVFDVDPVDVGGGHRRLLSAQLHLASYQPGDTRACPAQPGGATDELRWRARRSRGPGSRPTSTTSMEAMQRMKDGKAATSKVQSVTVSRSTPMLITAPT